ncbi:MAG: nitrite reductase (NAD(P)H) small subunit [Pseudonocardiales bacterium]|nr:MAG: nitrite reductase (NAD(P)H) small subunit [Pseudonocardiales bacterium]
MTVLAVRQSCPVQWTEVCGYDDMVPERPVAALVDAGQVAIVRLHDGGVHAVDNRDPFSGANVLARGIVGTAGDAHVLVSPMFKQCFDLRTGVCLDDPAVRLTVHPVQVVDGQVLIGTPG